MHSFILRNSKCSHHAAKKMNSKLKCGVCDKDFARRFTLQRHMATQHQEDDIDSGSEEENTTESIVQTDSEQDAESADESTDSQMEEEEAKEGVWKYYMDIAWQNASEEMNSADQNASTGDEEKVWKVWKKAMDKHFLDAYRSDILHYNELKEDLVHQAVMQSKKKLMKELDMSEDEATNAAVSQRKHLIVGAAPNWREKMTDSSPDE